MINEVRDFKPLINETTESNIKLYHGSNNQNIYKHFKDNQFFTVNDYIATNYAYNFGGLLYMVTVDSLNAFELNSYSKKNNPNEYEFMINLLKKLYNDEVVDNYERRYFTPSPSSTFMELGWNPIIQWAKENGYDSIKFIDESYDRYVRDVTYVIFNGNNVKINDVYDINDNVESDGNKPIIKK